MSQVFCKLGRVNTAVLKSIVNRQTALNKICKQSFATTSAVKARIYGPIEDGLPSATSHWLQERYVSISLLPLIPVALIFPNMALDMCVSAVLMLHTHWSLKGVLTDYIHGEYMKPFVNPSILILSILAFAGLCLLNINDVGFSRALRKIYTDL